MDAGVRELKRAHSRVAVRRYLVRAVDGEALGDGREPFRTARLAQTALGLGWPVLGA